MADPAPDLSDEAIDAIADELVDRVLERIERRYTESAAGVLEHQQDIQALVRQQLDLSEDLQERVAALESQQYTPDDHQADPRYYQ